MCSWAEIITLKVFRCTTPIVFTAVSRLCAWLEAQKPASFGADSFQARKSAKRPLGLRQKDVAKSVGLYQSAVTKWKTGKGLPTTDNVRALANEAGVSFDWLMTGVGQMRPTPAADDPDLVALIRHWHALNTEGRQYLLRTARLWHGSQFTGDSAAREEHEREMASYTIAHMQKTGVHEPPATPLVKPMKRK